MQHFYGTLTKVVADNLVSDNSSFGLWTSEGYHNNVLNINVDKTLSSVYVIKKTHLLIIWNIAV